MYQLVIPVVLSLQNSMQTFLFITLIVFLCNALLDSCGRLYAEIIASWIKKGFNEKWAFTDFFYFVIY